DRGQAMALALVLGKEDMEYNRTRIDDLLKRAINGTNGAEVLAGVFDALNRNAPGGVEIARTLLHGANRPEFPQYFSRISDWAARGDEASLTVLSGMLAGRCDNPELIEKSKKIMLFLADDKTLQPRVLERLMDAYKKDVVSAKYQVDRTKPASFLLLEVMGDVVAKQDKANLPEKLFTDVRDVFRKDLEWFADRHNFETKAPTPEQEKQREHLIRGFLSMSKHFEKTDIELITDRLGPSLAVALREKKWEIPKDLQQQFVDRVMAHVDGDSAKSALECLGFMGKLLTTEHLERWARKVQAVEANDPTVLDANAKALLNVIGTEGITPEVRSAAIKTLETTGWYSKLDSKIQDALSKYVNGKVSDVKLIDQVIALIGDCRIEPPIAVVVKRMGLPLTDELIRDIEAAERNMGGDRKEFLKVLQRVGALNALPPELTQLPHVDLGKLIKRMADAPLATDLELGFLVTDAVERRMSAIENAVLDKLVEKSNAFRAATGKPLLSR
ncbi:MAG: hypothetical protein K2Z81_04475, partial [Cyanobacteria bacterium]|nr:hypothetical protein [Cyanobacteriota bacterium]